MVASATSISCAVASSNDTINPYFASRMLYDSNFLRLSDHIDPLLITGKKDKSEFIRQVSAGFDMDWAISRQHVILVTNINQNWFQNFSNLDYIGWNNKAQWNWQIGNKLNGEIGYINIQALGSFVQLNSLIPNLQNNQRYFANGGYLFHPNGKVKFGVFRTENQYDDKGRQFSNNTEDNAEFNLQYLSSTGSILGVRLLATDGRYPQRQLNTSNAQDNAYIRMNYALTWDWHAKSKTRIKGLFGYTQQRYEHFRVRNFDDIIAEISLNWQASDKTLLELSSKRLITQADNVLTSFYLTQGVWFGLTWKTTPKIALMLPMSYQQQQYLGGPGNNAEGFERQKDNVSSIGLNLTYHPLDNIGIDAVLNHERRESNYLFRSYQTESAGVNVQMMF